MRCPRLRALGRGQLFLMGISAQRRDTEAANRKLESGSFPPDSECAIGHKVARSLEAASSPTYDTVLRPHAMQPFFRRPPKDARSAQEPSRP
jgi:hypothetical protein